MTKRRQKLPMIEPDENDIFPTEKPSWEEIGSMNEKIEDLRKFLRSYGRHKVGCCTGYDHPVWHPEEDCDCSWLKTKETLDLFPSPAKPD